MKVAVKAAEERYWKYQPEGDFSGLELVFFSLDAPDEEVLAKAGDAEALVIDAIAIADASLIAGMPNLKMIMSEGVAYNGIDVNAATERNIFVCNNAGINATAVAEQAVLLILGLLRSVLAGSAAIARGAQINFKEHLMFSGIREIGDCSIGLIGFGAIAKETARLLAPFGGKLYYTSRHRASQDIESKYGVEWLEQDELIRTCDIVSLHCPVTPATTNMVNDEFLAAMKNNALLINTARGDLVDNDAMVRALEGDVIGGFGVDTIAPEPVLPDNPLLNMSEHASAKMLASPHIGGVTTSTFRRGFANTWNNLLRVKNGERPINIVNGL